MASYLQRYDATPVAGRWPLVRGWMHEEPLAFYAELRKDRPILVMPEVTLATRFDDCTEILRRHELFSVALYKPKQGDYFMAQDDTAVHWREKSIMRAILDREDIPAIRTYVANKAAELLAAAGGAMEAVAGLTRAVPLALVQDWFGFAHSDPAKLCKWSYWSQIDTFWNQPFDSIAWPDPSKIVDERKAASKEMVVYLIELVARREIEFKAGLGGHDPVTRLLELSFVQGAEIRLAAGCGERRRIADRRGRDHLACRGQCARFLDEAPRRPRQGPRRRARRRSGRRRRLRVRSAAVQAGVSLFLPHLRAGYRPGAR